MVRRVHASYTKFFGLLVLSMRGEDELVLLGVPRAKERRLVVHRRIFVVYQLECRVSMSCEAKCWHKTSLYEVE